jgi:hypothetical protein
MKALTSEEMDALLECEKKKGSLRDCIITALRSYLNPDYIDFDYLIKTVEKAKRVAGIMQGSTFSEKNLDLEKKAEQVDKESQKPLKHIMMEMFRPLAEAMKMQVQQIIQESMKKVFNVPQVTPINNKPKSVDLDEVQD